MAAPMARNVLPTDGPRENEVLGLIYWSINFIKVVAFCSFFLGVWELVHAFALLVARSAVVPLSSLPLSLGFVFIGVETFFIFLFDKRYVSSEEEENLIRALFRLGDLWLIFAATAAAAAAPVIPYLIHRFTGLGIPFGLLVALYCVLALGIVALFGVTFRAQQRFSPPNHPIINEVPSFARRNIDRVRLIGFFSMGVGAFLVLLYCFDALPLAPTEPLENLFIGIVFLGVGGAITFYWRGVREIHRNPSLIYFERSLERLNLFWLTASVAFLIATLVAVFVS